MKPRFVGCAYICLSLTASPAGTPCIHPAPRHAIRTPALEQLRAIKGTGPGSALGINGNLLCDFIVENNFVEML